MVDDGLQTSEFDLLLDEITLATSTAGGGPSPGADFVNGVRAASGLGLASSTVLLHDSLGRFGFGCPSPVAAASEASTSAGVGCLSPATADGLARQSAVSAENDRKFREFGAMVDALEGLGLGVDGRAPLGFPPMKRPISPAYRVNYGDNAMAGSLASRGYGVHYHTLAPKPRLVALEENTYLPRFLQHCPANASLIQPWTESSPYGVTEFGAFGSNYRYREDFGDYLASSNRGAYPISDIYLPQEKIVDSDWGCRPMDGRTEVPLRPLPVRILRNLEGFESKNNRVGQGKGSNFMMNRLNNPKEIKIPLHAQKFSAKFPAAVKSDNLLSFKGSIHHMATDQNGCRYLQRKLDEGGNTVNMIFNDLIDHVVELMNDQFGNYLIQKLLEVCSMEQLTQIILMLKKDPIDFIRISLNVHGTRALQKLIDSVKTVEQISLVTSAIQPGFLYLIKDLNGSHVLQRCLETFKAEQNKFIFDAAAEHCVDIATHKHGCCVLQKCIGHSTGDDLEKLILEIASNGYELAQDPYGKKNTKAGSLLRIIKELGVMNPQFDLLVKIIWRVRNYVIQYILDMGNTPMRTHLARHFEGRYVQLSVQKFSSNVVEKCLTIFDQEDQATIIHELLSFPRFEQILQDPFANYVIQSALEICKGPLYASLVRAILPYEVTLRANPYCKRIFLRLKK